MSDTPSVEALRRDLAARLAAVSDNPDLEARRLLEAFAGLSGARLIIEARRALDPQVAARVNGAAARRLTGEPLAYIIGRVGFHDIELGVSPAVLVPRPDTETLVDTLLARLPAEAALRIADLGTGSGAIALALAHARPRWRLVATDAHDDALACARANAERLRLTNVRFARGTWFDALEAIENLDAIVSNPPYVDPADPHLEAAALRHEPRHALVSAENGLADIRVLAAGAARHLRADGLLAVEHGYDQGPAVRGLFTTAGLAGVETVADLAGRERATLGRASGCRKP